MSQSVRVLSVADHGGAVVDGLDGASDGLEVVTAADVETALERLADGAVDCIVVPAAALESDTSAFLTQIRSRDAFLPVILVTDGDAASARNGDASGLTEYVERAELGAEPARLATRIDDALERAAARREYGALFDSVAVGLAIRDVETGDLVDVNERYCELFGYSREEALALELADVTADVPDYSTQRMMRWLQDASTDGSATFEWPYLTRDGRSRWAEVDASTIHVGGRDRLLLTVQPLDDERERTLETLHDAAASIQACDTVEAVCDRTVEAAESILEFELCSLMLHEDGWLVPQSLSSEAPPDGARRMAADEGLAGKTYQNQESYTVADATSDADSDPTKETYRAGLSVPIGTHGIFQAVSDQPGVFDDGDVELAELLIAHTANTLDRLEYERELQERREVLERQNDRLDEFAGVISHDVRNPLNIAQSRLTLLAEEYTSEHIAPTERALDRIESIVEDTLTLARQGDDVVQTEPVDVTTLARACWGMVETDEATLDIADEFTIEGDSDRLRHVFENLLRNSVDHGGPAVTITIGQLDDGFYVEDDGSGIPADERDQVFDTGYSSAHGGTGFGLSIVAEIANAHGWTVTATDGAAGGARFEFTTD